MLTSIITKRLWRWACVTGLATLLSACSLIQTTYNQLPRIVYFWLDRQVDLTSMQSDQIQTALANWQAWHRQSELPQVASELALWSRLVNEKVDADVVCERFERVRDWTFEWLAPLNADLTRLGLNLSPAQVEHLRKAYAKSNATWREEWLEGNLQDLHKKRVKRGRDWAERLYGKLSAEQLRTIQQSVRESVFDAAQSFEWRRLRQIQMLSTLKQWSTQPPDFDQAQQQMRASVLMWRQLPDPDQRAQQDRLTRFNCQAIADFHNATTAAQRAHAVKVLQGYEADVRALIAEKK